MGVAKNLGQSLTPSQISSLKRVMESNAQSHINEFMTFLTAGPYSFSSMPWLVPSRPYGVILASQLSDYNQAVEDLHGNFLGKRDLSFEEITICLIYFFRAGELLKLKAAEYEKHRDDEIFQIHPKLVKTTEAMAQEAKESFERISSNLFYVMEQFGGPDWIVRMPRVNLGFTFYSEYWHAHARFP